MKKEKLNMLIKSKELRKCSLCGEMLPYKNFHTREYDKDKYKFHSSCKTCDLKRSNDRYETYSKFYNIKRKYGLTKEEYLTKLESQNFKCEICGKESEKFCVDHCHKTGIIRGFLCNSCNTAIGLFSDNPEILLSAIKYITKYRKDTF